MVWELLGDPEWDNSGGHSRVISESISGSLIGLMGISQTVKKVRKVVFNLIIFFNSIMVAPDRSEKAEHSFQLHKVKNVLFTSTFSINQSGAAR